MSQLLDLAITLTPPGDAHPEALASIALNCAALGLSHSGDLLNDPLSQKERDDLRWYLEEYWKWPYEGFAQRAKAIEELLPEIGKRLYDALFGSRQADRIIQDWLKKQGDHQISIISDISQVLSLPWELLHSERGFMVLRTQEPVSIIRRLSQSESEGSSSSFEPPLRVLLVTARPSGTGFIDPRGIARELLDEVQGQIEAGAIELEILRPPTLKALRKRLRDGKRPVHVLHFDGHGTFDENFNGQDEHVLGGSRRGKLAFENDIGELDLVDAEDLGQVLQNSKVKLTVLTACQSAMSSADNAFSSVAARLIQGGIDAVVAMSASVLVASATRYAEAFYRAIAEGTAVPTAQEEARQALHDDPERHLMHRRRDDEGKPVELRDWWLPHYYQQRTLELRPTRPSGKLDLQQASQERLNKDMPDEPRYGFTGRSYELLQIERHLLHGKLVVIHGFGGNGKTALAREAADWLTRTRMYERACFVSFEHGGDATMLLSALGNFMSVHDGNYNPNDSKMALARLKPALKEKPALVIADNLESILPGGDAPLGAEVRTQLWDVLLELSKLGAGVLLTSRDIAFDGKLERGKNVAHLAIGGLWPADAYTLASSLLNDLGIDRAKAPYAELRDLLKHLDHHPLSIQLVLPALDEYPIEKIRADFATLLSKFEDDTETGRNRSLLASLDYSLRRLSKEQRDLLPRLALFEGGASEDDLLAITEIPETEWGKLRPALEQAALLTPEQVGNITVPFLRFHPVLAPYLRTQPGADDVALRERYARRYYALADYLYYEDDRNPQPVRALVQKELPNLRRALELLLEAGDLDRASDMALSVARFLNFFGLRRELDEMRRRVNEAAARSQKDDRDFSRAELLRESGLGEDEYNRGNLSAAYTRFTKLLEQIELLPEGTPLGRGSLTHSITLLFLARCLRYRGQPMVADKRVQEALAVIDALIKQQPNDESNIRHRGVILTEFGGILRDQGRYQQARQAYMEALNIEKQLNDLRGQAVIHEQLGTLARKKRDYTEGQFRYTEALEIFRSLSEPEAEANEWHLLGSVALEQKEWIEAERCYRESLAINEHLGNLLNASMTCNNLAFVAKNAGEYREAEGWYKRALELIEQVNINSREQAGYLSNLASLLVQEVRAGRVSGDRLTDAHSYAQRSLSIMETFDITTEYWKILGLLAYITNLEGHTEEAQTYRRREHETYADFAGNRYHIDRQHGQLIAAIAAVAKGNVQARGMVEEALPKLEENGWKIADATRRIWAGERDWHVLAEGIDPNSALLVKRVLETIEQPPEEQNKSPEQILASLPASIQEAIERSDQVAFQQMFEALSLEEQHAVMEAMQYLQGQQEGEEEDDEEPEDTSVLKQFEPLLQAIAVVAAGKGDADLQTQIETTLATLEEKGWHLRDAVQRIWDGDHDPAALMEGLDEQDAAVIQRVLEIIAEPGK